MNAHRETGGRFLMSAWGVKAIETVVATVADALGYIPYWVMSPGFVC